MSAGTDRAALAAGIALMATGGALLADDAGAFDLSARVVGALFAALLLISAVAFAVRRPSREIAAPTTGQVLTAQPGERPLAERDSFRDLYRGGFGIALLAGAVLVALWQTGAIGAIEGTLVSTLVGGAAFLLILAPFWWRLGQSLAQERAERIRSQERAAVAAHLHDSVLQTLTLVQKRADDPREVAQLARAQERELRQWLFDGRGPDASESVTAALEAAAASVEDAHRVPVSVEDAHRVPVEVVAVGDAPMDARGEAIVGAAREAMVNAAKFAPDAGPVAVYAELSGAGAQVFVRDRGDGFDPGALPAGRQGVRESIIGRMERAGGSAHIRSTAAGTEVELEMTATR